MAQALDASEPASALRAYLVLLGFAAAYRTTTYEDLLRRVRLARLTQLGEPLERLARWCQRNGLPPLTALAVERASGLPTLTHAGIADREILRRQELVYEFDWLSIHPPGLEELAAA